MASFDESLRGRVDRGGLMFLSCTVALTVLANCAASSGPVHRPPFRGVETPSWIAYEVTVPERGPDDLLRSFEASARRYGCSTEHLRGGAHAVPRSQLGIVGDENRYFGGVAASCGAGDIALVAEVDAPVKIGCSKPTTRERCDSLLRAISEAR